MTNTRKYKHMKKIILIFFVVSSITFSQELNCNVIVNFESLPMHNRELLRDFGAVVQDYMNITRFTNSNWEGDKIDCSLNIFFITASGDVSYSAQIVVVSQRPVYQSTHNSPILTINDGLWSFKYEVGQSMYPDFDSFDPLTSLLDFYANLIIASDWDTWEEFGGTPYYKEAFDILNLAANSNNTNGWVPSSSAYSRYGMVSDALNEKYASFRSAIFDYHYGIDIYAQNQQVGQEKIVSLINVLYAMYERYGIIKSVFVKSFFDAKYSEIIERLRSYPDETVFTKLKNIDPSHAGKYEALMP
jgi:Domain of unknown function (DUF4835)